jgi:hypothetical protein
MSKVTPLCIMLFPKSFAASLSTMAAVVGALVQQLLMQSILRLND